MKQVPKIGQEVVRTKGDYVVGRKGVVVELDTLMKRAQVKWHTASKSWVKYDVIEPAEEVRIAREYSLCEAVADMAIAVTEQEYDSGCGSRAKVQTIILWAKEFEAKNEGVQWGIDEGREYIDEIYAFATEKMQQN